MCSTFWQWDSWVVSAKRWCLVLIPKCAIVLIVSESALFLTLQGRPVTAHLIGMQIFTISSCSLASTREMNPNSNSSAQLIIIICCELCYSNSFIYLKCPYRILDLRSLTLGFGYKPASNVTWTRVMMLNTGTCPSVGYV